jgi:hypothetical protein
MASKRFHFLYLDPLLEENWLFEAAPRYWEVFRPIVVHNLELIDYVPKNRALAITIITRRDVASKVIAEIEKRFGRAQLDPLVYDVVRDLKLTLDGRAALSQRFGRPE